MRLSDIKEGQDYEQFRYAGDPRLRVRPTGEHRKMGHGRGREIKMDCEVIDQETGMPTGETVKVATRTIRREWGKMLDDERLDGMRAQQEKAQRRTSERTAHRLRMVLRRLELGGDVSCDTSGNVEARLRPGEADVVAAALERAADSYDAALRSVMSVVSS